MLISVLRSIGFVSYRLSGAGRRRLGAFAATVLRVLSPSRVRITVDNIRHAFPEQPAEWHKILCRESYHNLGITLVELLMFPHLVPSEARQLIRFDNLDEIEECNRSGQGMLLLSGHYGNWELLAFVFPLFVNVPTSVIVTQQANKYVDMYLNWYRSRTGNRMIQMDKAARQIVNSLHKGEAIALLADQAATADKDVFVPFFGRLAATYEAPAVLALRYNAPLFVTFAERNSDGTYTATFRRIPHQDLPNNREGITELTRRHVLALEEAIRKRPELWAWQHRRWKHEPPAQEVGTTSQNS